MQPQYIRADRRKRQPQTLSEWLSSQVCITETCWIWTGGLVRGYGAGTYQGRQGYAHRFAWEAEHGPIPAGMLVCHRCDNPPCVRPDHLFLGTNADNMADRNAKGRHSHGVSRPGAKLTDAAVLEIRARHLSGDNHPTLSASFGVSLTTISDILNGKKWGHVTGHIRLPLLDRRILHDCIRCGTRFLALPTAKYCSRRCLQRTFDEKRRRPAPA